MARFLSRGELAREVGVNAETLRYYERRGLIDQPARTASGHRRYDSEAASLVRMIRRSQDLGFTLSEIRDLLRELKQPKAICDDVCQAIETRIGRVNEELARLRSLRGRLTRLRSTCPRTRPLRECPVIVELRAPERERRNR